MTVWGGVFYVQSFFPHGLCCPDHFALVDVGMPGPHLDPVPLWLRWCLDVDDLDAMQELWSWQTLALVDCPFWYDSFWGGHKPWTSRPF